VRTARAKGLTRAQTLRRHVLRNAMIPLVTVMGLQFANLLAGTIVVENVFALPGIGRLILQAIAQRDLVVVRDVVTVLARTDDDPHGGLTFFVVEKGMPGFSVSRALRKTGWWASDTAELQFDEVRVPARLEIALEPR